MKSLIFYYSCDDKTKSTAEELGRITGSELRKVEEVAANKGVLRYLLTPLQALAGLGSELRPYNPDMTGYGRVFIGTPAIGGNPAPAISTLLGEIALKNKKIVVFCTHAAGKAGSVLKKMENIVREKGGLAITQSKVARLSPSKKAGFLKVSSRTMVKSSTP